MDDKINYFFMERKKYRTSNKKKCINCSRNVGTKFSIELWESKRIYKIQCGDENDPCDLNKIVEVKKYIDKYDELLILKENLNELSKEISIIKNKLIFEIISEEVYKEFFTELEDKYKTTLIDIKNLEKKMFDIDQQEKTKNNEYIKLTDENRKISELNMRINHYLAKIHQFKYQQSELDEIIKEQKNNLKSDPINFYYLKKNSRKKI